MPVVISGTNGVSGVDGTASNPSYEGTDSNTGIFFPAADTIAFAEGGTEVMRIDSSGNVGIGTSLPGAKLMAYAATGTSISLNNSTTGTTAGSGFQLQVGSATDAYIWNYSNGPMVFATNNTERARITSGGDMQFNTTSQFFYLNNIGSVSSAAAILVRNSTQGVQLTANATSWAMASDERLKTDLAPITNATEKVQELRAVTGRYKTDDEQISRAFVIAQDVQRVLPQAVTEIEQDGEKYLGLQYTDLIPLLTAAIQEQQQMIETLQAKVAALEAK